MDMKAPQSFEIAGRKIGPDEPPFIIAEMSGNHNGDISRALAIVEMAADAGADAIKLQTYRADTITIDHNAEEFMIRGGLWDGRSLYELYEKPSPLGSGTRKSSAAQRTKASLPFQAPLTSPPLTFLRASRHQPTRLRPLRLSISRLLKEPQAQANRSSSQPAWRALMTSMMQLKQPPMQGLAALSSSIASVDTRHRSKRQTCAPWPN